VARDFVLAKSTDLARRRARRVSVPGSRKSAAYGTHATGGRPQLAVTRVVFEWDLVATGSVTNATTSFDLQVDEDSLQFLTVNLLQGIPPFTEVTSASGSEEPFAAALPIGAGAYDVVNSLFGLGGFGPGPRSWTASYRWTITAQ